MKKIHIGHSGIEISAIIMGLWQAGKSYWVGVQDTEVVSAIHKAIDSGVNAFDTAEEYGNGYSENLLSSAIRGKRKQLVLMSKVFSNHLKYEQVIEACERSLKNLKTDYIDLYQIHWPSGSWGTELVPIEETMRALNDLKKSGKICSIGVSNFSLQQLKEAMQFGQIDSLQSPYSLFWRFIENEIQSFCLKNEISFLAYSPLAQGFLTGKFKSGHQFHKKDNRNRNKLNQPEVFQKVLQTLLPLQNLAEKKNISLAELALAWVIQHENTAAIAGARNADQMQINAQAGGLPDLTSNEMQYLEHHTKNVSDLFINDSIPWGWNP